MQDSTDDVRGQAGFVGPEEDGFVTPTMVDLDDDLDDDVDDDAATDAATATADANTVEQTAPRDNDPLIDAASYGAVGFVQEEPPPNESRQPPPSLFSSSFCDMFQTRTFNQSDACALACCGIWLWERNQYLMDGTIPKSYKERPLMLAVAFIFTASLVLALTSQIGNLLSEDVITGLMLLLLVGAALVLFQFQASRSASRRQLAMLHYISFEASANATALDLRDDEGYRKFMFENKSQISNGHGCVSCYPSDSALHAGATDPDRMPDDFCAELWRCFGSFCCEACCSCWCVCCGICGIAQEHRHLYAMSRALKSSRQEVEVDDLVERSLWRRDYITFQPWADYAPRLQQLRDLSNGNLFAHFGALSQLSKRLLWAVVAIVAFVLIWAMLPFTSVSFWQFLVLLGALLQPILVLTYVHWTWNRFDISLDAVVKYFASGFVICTSMAFVYEVVIDNLVVVVLAVSAVIGSTVFDADDDVIWDLDGEIGDEDGNSSKGNIGEYAMFQQVLAAFLKSFLVAALLEEIAKYMSFWMIEHPDLQDVFDWNSSKRRRGNQEPHQPTFNRASKGAAITVAMVSTALGFACAENLMYVFVYAPPGVSYEVDVLVSRSLFPLHPLFAAFQSLGVCQRELLDNNGNETQKSMQLGKILLPAIFIHGLYDFILFALPIFVDQDEDDGRNSTNNDEAADDEIDQGSIVFFALTGGIMMTYFYYMYLANKQNNRLEQKDAGMSIAPTTLSNEVV